MTEAKRVKIDGMMYEERGPYCQLCGGHMGTYYNIDKGGIANPHGRKPYGKNTCPHCGAKYEYNEGDMLVLTEEDKKALLAIRGKKAIAEKEKV